MFDNQYHYDVKQLQPLLQLQLRISAGLSVPSLSPIGVVAAVAAPPGVAARQCRSGTSAGGGAETLPHLRGVLK